MRTPGFPFLALLSCTTQPSASSRELRSTAVLAHTQYSSIHAYTSPTFLNIHTPLTHTHPPHTQYSSIHAYTSPTFLNIHTPLTHNTHLYMRTHLQHSLTYTHPSLIHTPPHTSKLTVTFVT